MTLTLDQKIELLRAGDYDGLLPEKYAGYRFYVDMSGLPTQPANRKATNILQDTIINAATVVVQAEVIKLLVGALTEHTRLTRNITTSDEAIRIADKLKGV